MMVMSRSRRRRSRSSCGPHHCCHGRVLVVSIFLLIVPTAVSGQTIDDNDTTNANEKKNWTCDVLNDTCPLPYLYNGICQQQSVPESLQELCQNGDCYDCDPCRRHKFDCNGCLGEEQDVQCYWCPYSGECYGSPYYPQVLGLTDPNREPCLSPDDYETSQCTATANEEEEEVVFGFSDPLYNAQEWVFDMINVQPVWDQKGYRGTGVRVRINDNGVEASHPEFEGRFDIEGSCEQYLAPTDGRFDDFHGTSVAAIIGASANNNVCSVGVAPGVTISSCALLDYPNQSLAYNLDFFDISNNSWGIDGCTKQGRRGRRRRRRHRSFRELQQDTVDCPFTFVDNDGFGFCNPCEPCGDFSADMTPTCERAIVNHCTAYYKEDTDGCLEFIDLIIGGSCEFRVIPDRQRDEILTGIKQGRNGKGIIYVFASGNEFVDHTNFQPYTNSRFLISVAGLSKSDGRHASYSTPGPGIFVSAPAGDKDTSPNHVTANLGGGCHDATYATSLATPVVSGVIALMLEANPELSWRDVQSILALSSQRVDDDPLDTTAVVNAAGLWHSELYGFGIIDAFKAVDMAESWESVGEEEMIMVESGEINLPLGDGPTSSNKVESTLSLTLDTDTNDDFALTAVVVYLDIDHSSRGHLRVTLTSPGGTESVLLPGGRPEATQIDDEERWKLLTVRSWGEKASGDWTLSILDTVDGDVADCVDLPFTYTLDGIEYSCKAFYTSGLCLDGILDPYNVTSPELFAELFLTEQDGLLTTQACCQCGGGMSTSTFSDKLTQWRLVTYGQTQQGGLSSPEDDEHSSDSRTNPLFWGTRLIPIIVSCILLRI